MPNSDVSVASGRGRRNRMARKMIPYYQVLIHKEDWKQITNLPMQIAIIEDKKDLSAYYHGPDVVEQYSFRGYDYVNHEDIMPYKPEFDAYQERVRITDLFSHPDISVYFRNDLALNASEAKPPYDKLIVRMDSNLPRPELIQTFRGRFYHPYKQHLKIWYEFVFKPCGKTAYADHYQVNFKIKNESKESLMIVDAVWTVENSVVAGIPVDQRAASDLPARNHDNELFKQKPELHPWFSPCFSHTFHQEIEHGVHRPRCSRGRPALFKGKLYMVGKESGKFELNLEEVELYPPNPRDIFKAT